jgi:hypothetical protein
MGYISPIFQLMLEAGRLTLVSWARPIPHRINKKATRQIDFSSLFSSGPEEMDASRAARRD